MRKRFDWDDPRLTAYVLGELSERERAEIEAELAKNDVAREIVAQIRETADLLTSELQEEPSPALTPEQRAAVLGWTGRAAPRRFGRFFVLVTSAAACLVVVAGAAYKVYLSQRPSPTRQLAMITEEAELSSKSERGAIMEDKSAPVG
ncbi:MAG: hypothetical protein KAJ01_01995, partial [Candidatus Hydrogenedentes bacterium]|nr:hypothetical protein [Candidatus Hydrogenedentota bacterium]